MLVSSPDLSLGALLSAEALVAAELGITSLETRNVAESGTVGGSGLIALRGGPCTALSSLTLAGAPAAGVLETPWLINTGRLGGLYGWPASGSVPYTVNYTAGWTAATLPVQITQAVLITARVLEARPDPTVKAESEGPVSRSWDTSAGLPAHASALLAPWQQVRF